MAADEALGLRIAEYGEYCMFVLFNESFFEFNTLITPI